MLSERLVNNLGDGQAVEVCLVSDRLDPAVLAAVASSAALETGVTCALARSRLSTTESTGLVSRRLQWRGCAALL